MQSEAGDPIEVVEFAEVGAEGYAYLRRRTRVPVVVRCHTPTAILRRHYTAAETPYGTFWTERLERFCILNADALTAPSRDTARVVAELCSGESGPIAAIPNLIEAELFGDSVRRANTRAKRNEVVVLHVGRLERVKGVEVLAQAIPRVLAAVPQTRFVFVGEDRELPDGTSCRARLEEYLQSEGAMAQVNFTGVLTQAEMLEHYGNADICVVPTLNYESFSYTCCQGMAAGLPVVATRIGGIPETVDADVSGILVEPGNATELAEALLTVIRDAGLRARMGRAGRATVEQRFDASVVAERMVDVYSATVEGCQRNPV
jgi:glycosyltransferase involved in cell wall biosynthesis